MNILWLLPKKIAHKILYRIRTKQKLQTENPKTLNEKIQYIIINNLLGEKETKCTDKFLMREYVKEKGYENNLPKLYNTYKNAKEINFSNLPAKFVLKTNNGSGGVIICKNKMTFNNKVAVKTLNKNLKKNYAKRSLEYHYSKIKPLIICEEYLDDGTGNAPIDYKFFCFKGKPKYIMVCINRFISLKKVYYDTNWNYLEDFSTYKYEKIPKPENFEEMIKISEKLSEDFNFVRVDLYNINKKVYIGELTFTSDAGMGSYLTDKAQKILGNEIEL